MPFSRGCLTTSDLTRFLPHHIHPLLLATARCSSFPTRFPSFPFLFRDGNRSPTSHVPRRIHLVVVPRVERLHIVRPIHAKAADLHCRAVVDENVGRCQVSMCYAVAVEILQSAENLYCYCSRSAFNSSA